MGEVLGELGCVDHLKCFVVGMSGRGRPVEGSCDHFAVVDHGELVVQLVAACEARGADFFYRQRFRGNRSGMLRSFMGP